MIYIAGPEHDGPGIVANTYLEGIYSEVYPKISQDASGLQGHLFIAASIAPVGRTAVFSVSLV